LSLLSTELWKDDFNPGLGLNYHDKTIDSETVMGLYTFSKTFKKSDSIHILKDNLSGHDLWKKLMTEIYKYIDSR